MGSATEALLKGHKHGALGAPPKPIASEDASGADYLWPERRVRLARAGYPCGAPLSWPDGEPLTCRKDANHVHPDNSQDDRLCSAPDRFGGTRTWTYLFPEMWVVGNQPDVVMYQAPAPIQVGGA